MPEVRNFTQGAPPEEQDGAEMFQWKPGTEDDGGHVDFLVKGELLGRVRPVIGRWEGIAHVGEVWVLLPPLHNSEDRAREAMIAFWRAAARTTKELGLCDPTVAPTPCFAVKDAAGHDHVYETPALACRVRIASDGSLRDVVDMDGNPIEIRKAERS